jgi:imidazolonepropionase
MADLPPELKFDEQHDCAGALVTPGLIDCHTHLVFAGNRASEFEMRLHGAGYEDIARAGGGIFSTVRLTREADEDELFRQSEPRLRALMDEGVTTVEIKSGYGLNFETELKMLRVARRLGEHHALTVKTTFLGAHAIPPEYGGRGDAYVDWVCEDMLPVVVARGLCDAVDVFCENIGFTPAQTRRIFEAARRQDLPVKLHAEQLSNQQGASLAAEFGALSADHLEYLDEHGVRAMAASGTVAVLLPGAFYFLRETQLPPIAALRSHHVPIAVASDLNPGTSPIVSLLASMHMAATLFRLTPLEILRGVTVNAARALGLAGSRGALAAGMRADFCVWDVAAPAELCYWMGGLKPAQVVRSGVLRHG